jgi:SAM-dependent methyltransferase
MSSLRRLFFNWMYLRRPPWDTGISPPELIAFISSNPPGRALDLGCGTGTNAITLARHGWTVTAVDFALRGVIRARKKAALAGVAIDFRVADVTRLDNLEGTFDLILDIGCFHGLSRDGQLAYAENLARFLVPRGTYLMYGFFRPPGSNGPGMLPDGLRAFDTDSFELVERVDGFDRQNRPSAWVTYRRKIKSERPMTKD